MNNLMMKIEIFSNDELTKRLIEVKKDRDFIDKQWNLCDSGKLDGDDVAYLSDEKEQKLTNNLSIYIMSKKMDNFIDRKENEQYDVTKIKVSENLYEKMKSYDKELLTIWYKDTYSEDKINRDLSMIHFMSGFSVDKDLKDDSNIYILKDVIRTNNDK